jgi:hypothetical protein
MPPTNNASAPFFSSQDASQFVRGQSTDGHGWLQGVTERKRRGDGENYAANRASLPRRGYLTVISRAVQLRQANDRCRVCGEDRRVVSAARPAN